MKYQKYVDIQIVKALLHEEGKSKWAERQRLFVRKIVKDIKKTDLILDCACGDGIGIEALRNLGFKDSGVDLAETKLDRARRKILVTNEQR